MTSVNLETSPVLHRSDGAPPFHRLPNPSGLAKFALKFIDLAEDQLKSRNFLISMFYRVTAVIAFKRVALGVFV